MGIDTSENPVVCANLNLGHTEGADKILDQIGGVRTMYTQEQMIVAVETYMQLHSTRKTIQCLGYPGSRNPLRLWVNST